MMRTIRFLCSPFRITIEWSTRVRLFSQSRVSFATKLNELLLNMPKVKNVLGASEVRAAVLKNKAKRSGYEPSDVTLHILGPGSVGASRALMLTSDSIVYLFNCGEGAQRLITEHKMKLIKLEQIFLTSNCWENFGGLPGLAITAADMGIPNLSLHGPPDCERLILESQGFVNIDEMTIFKKDCWSPVDFTDELLSVKAIPLLGPKKEDAEDVPSPFSDSFYYDKRGTSSPPKGRIHLLSESESDVTEGIEPGCKRPRMPEMPEEMKRRKVALAYIVRTRSKMGTLLLDRCVDLGVPKGPLLGKLKSDIAVTLDDGRVIDPKEVRSPDDPGKTFLVVDCPSDDYLQSLCDGNLEHFRAHFKDGLPEDHPCVVVHFTPQSVMRNDRYREWVRQFPETTCHLLLNGEVDCSGALDVHRMQTKLNLLDDTLFPLLKESYPDPPSEGMNGASGDGCYSWMRSKTSLPDCPNAWLGYPGVRYRLRARRNEAVSGFDRQGYLHVKRQEYLDEVMAFPDAPKLIGEARERISMAREKKSGLSTKYPEIVFLGTGSAIPNKSRNTSGILVSLSETSKIIMDCGEGTLGQLVRFFGSKSNCPPPCCWDVLRQVDAVYISHLHADHHIGLIGILLARRDAFLPANNPARTVFRSAAVVAPPGLRKWLDWYSAVFEDVRDTYEFFDSKAFLSDRERDVAGIPVAARLTEKLGAVAAVETCYVPHCFHAFGVRFDVKSEAGEERPFRLVYSGDCRPSDALVKLGLGGDDSGCDLLIHEATVEDDLAEDAAMKRHCTASEALDVARRMKARRVMFTHFSQRYKIPVLSDEVAASVGVAFDYMRVTPDDFDYLPSLYRPLRVMFAEHVEAMELKTSKYLKRKGEVVAE